MTDDLSLDHETVDLQLTEAKAGPEPENEWLKRRMRFVGGSDMPVALIVAGLVSPPDDTPDYIMKRTKVLNTTRGYPRIVVEKAGILAPYRAGRAASIGTAREQELLRSWASLGSDERTPEENTICVGSALHASSLPQEWFPLRDHLCDDLAVTPDGVCRDLDGKTVGIEIKCTGWRQRLPWYWKAQAVALCAAQNIERTFVVMGLDWAVEHRPDGPILSFEVRPTQEQLDKVRAAAKFVMDKVREVSGDA